MRFSGLHKVVTYAMATLGLLGLGIGGELNPVAFYPTIALGVLSWWSDKPGHFTQRVPQRAWQASIFVFLFVAVFVLGDPYLPAVLETAAWLQVTRLFSRKTAQDHQQIAILAFMHLTAATVLAVDLEFAFLFIAFVFVTPWMFTLSHVRREVEQHYQGKTTSEADIARVLNSRRLIGPGFLALTATLSVPLFVGMSFLFLLFPRIGFGVLTFGPRHGAQVAGFGREITLGGFGTIRDDPSVVLRVQVPARGTGVFENGALRMRGTSFDTYDGKTWSRRLLGQGPANERSGYVALHGSPDPARDIAVRVLLSPIDEPVVFLPTRTVAFSVLPRVRSSVDSQIEVIRAAGDDFRHSDDESLELEYIAYVRDAGRPIPLGRALEGAERARYLAMPKGHSRLEQLAKSTTAQARTDREKALAILHYLRDQKRYSYTLDLPEVGERPVESFLFETKRGHCEYFSTAMALMLRAASIPSRNAAGFLGGRYNSYGRYYSLRQGDAHSWVEAYLEGEGWVTFDPTPGSRQGVVSEASFMTKLEDVMDALRSRWTRDVVGFDLRRQMELGTRLRDYLRNTFGNARDMGSPRARVGPKDKPAQPPIRWAVAFLCVGAAGLGVVLLVRRYRRRPEELAPYTVSAALGKKAKRVLAAYDKTSARIGQPRSRSMTPLEHAASLASSEHDGAEAALELARIYIDLRFAEHDHANAEIDASIAQYAEFAE